MTDGTGDLALVVSTFRLDLLEQGPRNSLEVVIARNSLEEKRQAPSRVVFSAPQRRLAPKSCCDVRLQTRLRLASSERLTSACGLGGGVT